MLFEQRRKFQSISKTLAIALVAAAISTVQPINLEADASYLSVSPGAITFNDRVCNLGDPANHTTPATAFEISTSAQLWEITDCVSNSATIYFELGDDIDVTQATTAPTSSPIGFSTSALAYSFSGVLDGKNRVISGISMSATSYGVGLFAHIYNATFSNLAIAGSFETTTGTVNNASHAAGALAVRATNNITLASISNFASVSGNWYVGGLVGRVDGDVSVFSSRNTGEVSGDQAVGGLLGYVSTNAQVVSSSNAARISGQFGVGGLVGRVLNDANISASANSGNIFGPQGYVGGLVGDVRNDATIISSRNTGEVSGRNTVGGLMGFLRSSASISSSHNSATVSGTLGKVGGLIGDLFEADVNSSYNIGNVFGNAADVGGFFGWVHRADFDFSYNAGSVTGTVDVDGLAGTASGTITTTSAYSTATSRYLASSTDAQLRLANTFIGFDFSSSAPVWGFGTCFENGGYPMLRAFGEVATYYSNSCYTAPPISAPIPASPDSQASVYLGPIVSSAQTAHQGSEVVFIGQRLDAVTTAFIGTTEVSISSATSQSLVLSVSWTAEPGTFDLILHSSHGVLTFQSGITVLPAESIEFEVSDGKLSIGSFNGHVVIYTKGHEGQRLSAKVAGKWLVVPKLSESWKGNGYSRTVRLTGAGNEILVHLYIDGKFVKTEELTTR